MGNQSYSEQQPKLRAMLNQGKRMIVRAVDTLSVSSCLATGIVDVVAMVILRKSARSVKTVDDSDTEDLEINNKPVCFQLDTGVMCCH